MSGAKTVVRRIPGKGRGVVALVRLEAGEIMERAPAISLDRSDTDTIAATCLDDYYFAHPGDPDGGLLVLGHATLINHSDIPNTETTVAWDHTAGWTVTLRTLSKIAAGAELTRRYACALWFDPA